MSGAAIVLIASLVILPGGELALEPPLEGIVRPGDVGMVFYELRVDNEARVVEIGPGVVLRSDDRGTTLGLEPGVEARSGLEVRFEIPVERLSLDELVRASGKTGELESRLREGVAARTVPAPVSSDVAKRVEGWARAWGRQDVDDYLSFYSERFRPGDGSSLEDWKRLRRRQLTAPEFVELELGEIETEPLAPDRASAHFLQTFRSDRYRDSVRKRLTLVLEQGHWRIVEEVVEEQLSASPAPRL